MYGFNYTIEPIGDGVIRADFSRNGKPIRSKTISLSNKYEVACLELVGRMIDGSIPRSADVMANAIVHL